MCGTKDMLAHRHPPARALLVYCVQLRYDVGHCLDRCAVTRRMTPALPVVQVCVLSLCRSLRLPYTLPLHVLFIPHASAPLQPQPPPPLLVTDDHTPLSHTSHTTFPSKTSPGENNRVPEAH